MKITGATAASIVIAIAAASASGSDDPALHPAYQDHIAYVATFAIPVLIEKCAALDPA